MIVVNKKSKLSIAIILVIVSLIIIGGSYAFFEAIVDKDIYVSFSSSYYSDSGGASGKYAIFSKIENGVETEYYRLEQLNNTKNYGKYLFTAGTYSLTLSADYIVFDEWHLSNS